MTQKDSLGDRMKQYESVTRRTLMRRVPVILRLDGRAFHTYAKRFATEATPFSDQLHDLMVNVTYSLVAKIQGCVFGYTQSDEISLILRDYDTHETQNWFGGIVDKINSVSASIATASFAFHLLQQGEHDIEKISDLAQFDARCSNYPKDEVCNYMLWRQQDATRNSVQMLGHYYFSQSQMQGKTNPEVQEMLHSQHGINWNNLPTWNKRGTAVYRGTDSIIVDENIPIFSQDREYVNRFVYLPEVEQE